MNFRQFIGMLVASVFSLTYLLGPLYMIASLLFLALRPSLYSAIFIAPLLLSAMLPPVPLPGLLRSKLMGCMREYFEYEQIFEISDEDLFKKMEEYKKKRKSIILTGVPHGVISFGGLCAGTIADVRYAKLCTAVAGAVLQTPIIKHVMGIYGLIDASAKSLKKHLAKGGIEGSIVLYTGGIAELFKCSETDEILFLKERKGFIKLALREGADIMPLYFFGNTSVLSIPKSRFLESISRSMQMSLTLFWGQWGLPIPRQNKILYVRGPILELPKIDEPSDEDVNVWHAKYVAEVKRIFDTYKSKVPEYKNKELIIQ